MLNNLVAWLKQKTFLRKLVLRNTNLFKRTIWDYEYRSGDWDYINYPPAEYFASIIDEHLQGGSILDLGCGTGSLLPLLAPQKRWRAIATSSTFWPMPWSNERKSTKQTSPS